MPPSSRYNVSPLLIFTSPITAMQRTCRPPFSITCSSPYLKTSSSSSSYFKFLLPVAVTPPLEKLPSSSSICFFYFPSSPPDLCCCCQHHHRVSTYDTLLHLYKLSFPILPSSLPCDLPNNGSSDSVVKEHGLILTPVLDNASGEGLPYAPVNWPSPGDVWGWKVGKRKTTTGFMLDRYLYPPWRLQEVMRGKKHFASFQSIKEFVQKEFPDADHDAFFASFSWKVPAKGHYREKDLYLDNPELRMSLKCKARNKLCSLQPEAKSNSLPVMECDFCCSEPHFCRDCCCILCFRGIDWAYGGYSFIRCEAIMDGNTICGHAAHIDCALRSYMAGTVGGSIRLDVEYHCRRCDMRTDLISHVTRLLDTCESLESQDDIKKILKTGLRILRGTHRESATRLLTRIEMALIKLESGIHPKEIWNVEDSSLVVSSVTSHLGKKRMLPGLEDTNGQSPPERKKAKRSHQQAYITSDHQMEYLKLEEDIEQVLEDLRKSQELEFRMAEDKLNAQKHLLGILYQKVNAERSQLAERTASTRGSDVDALLTKILNSVNQIKQEAVKFKDIEKVAKGFGRTPSSVLKEHFGIHVDD